MKKISERELREWFLEFNVRYFHGTLPVKQTRVVFGKDNKMLGWFTPIEYRTYRTKEGTQSVSRQDRKSERYGIGINEQIRFSGKLVMCTLLHEMAHLKHYRRYGKCGHGHLFQREMKRLVKLGAMNGKW